MTRQLLLLRHAKSSWTSAAATDFDRPLAKRGKQDAPKVGTWLHQQGMMPDYILSSPAKRAKKTAVKVCRALGLAKDRIHWEQRLYEAETDTLLSLLAECPTDAGTVLMVGHNPGLESLLEYLCGDEIPITPDGKLLPTAALAQLQMPPEWADLQPETAQLVTITRPRSLPAVG